MIFENDQLLFVDDYAHHPEEIKATLKGLRQAAQQRRLVCIFQPHRYSRTQQTCSELLEAFEGVDRSYIAPIYSAGETPI